MPYLTPEARRPLARAVSDLEGLIFKPGDLAYVIYVLLLHLCQDQHYEQIAAWRGAAQDAITEHYRRFVAHYEDGKIVDNGDIL